MSPGNGLDFVPAQNARDADAERQEQQRSGYDGAGFRNRRSCGRRFGVAVAGDAGDVRSFLANVAEIQAIRSVPRFADVPNIAVVVGILNDHTERIVGRSVLAVKFHGEASPVQLKVESIVPAAGL